MNLGINQLPHKESGNYQLRGAAENHYIFTVDTGRSTSHECKSRILESPTNFSCGNIGPQVKLTIPSLPMITYKSGSAFLKTESDDLKVD